MFQSLIIYDTGSKEKKKFSLKGEERLSLRQLSGNFPDCMIKGCRPFRRSLYQRRKSRIRKEPYCSGVRA